MSIPGDRQEITPEQFGHGIPSEEYVADPVQTPVVDESIQTPVETEALPVSQENANVEPVAVDDGLVDFTDEFGGTHRVTPATKNYLEYKERAGNTPRQVPQNTPAYVPQTTQTIETDDLADDASLSQPERDWRAMRRDQRDLRRQVETIGGMLNGSYADRLRENVYTHGTHFLKEIIETDPYLKGNKLVADEVRGDIEASLRQAVNGLRGNEQVDPQEVRAIVFRDSQKLKQKYQKLAGGNALANAQVRAQARNSAIVPGGGHGAAPAIKKKDLADMTRSQGNKELHDYAADWQRRKAAKA